MTVARAGVRSKCRRAAALIVAAVVLAACGGNGEQTAPHASPSTSSSPPAEETGPSYRSVYFLVDTPVGVRLAVEEPEFPAGLPDDEVPAAMVRKMISGPDDPDYTSPWNPRTRVLSVRKQGDVVTVDLSPAARRADAGSEVAERMVQQLVYTVTESEGASSKVLLLIAGEPAGDLWGTVSWSEPIGRAEPRDVRLPVQIGTPSDGAFLASPVHVVGGVVGDESRLPWRVLDPRGNVVRSGSASVATDSMIFMFEVPLGPGTYTLEVAQDHPSGGPGHRPVKDTKTFTVG
jgi:hypothetical protein